MSKSRKARLSAKAPRRIKFPVQVSDPGTLAQKVTDAEQQLALVQLVQTTAKDRDAARKVVADAEKSLADLKAELGEHYEPIEFQAAHPAAVEAILGEHTDKNGDWERTTALAPLAALCAVDADLQDEAWWVEQLNNTEGNAGAWSLGEGQALWKALIELNISAPPVNLPKG